MSLGRDAESSESLRVDVIAIASEESDYGSLLNQAFALKEGESFLDDFPVWGTKGPAETLRIGAYRREKLVASTSARVAHLKTPVGLMKVGLIGGVATLESWRGKGIASRLVTLAVDWLHQNQVGLVALWGSEYEMYQRLGFELCGEQVRLPLKEVLGSIELRGSSEPIVNGWRDSLFPLMKKRDSGLFFQESDLSWISEHKNVDWYSMGRSYAAIGRGIDMKGIVHEWSGPLHELKSLFREILKKYPEAQIISSRAGMKSFRAEVKEENIEYLALIKILDPVRVLHSYFPNLEVKAGQNDLGWTLQMGKNTVKGLSQGDLPQFLFGPSAGASSEEILPLPLWIWGLDSA